MKNSCFLLLVSFLGNWVDAQVQSLDSLITFTVVASLPVEGSIPVCVGQLPNGNICYNNLDGNIYQIKNGTAQLLFGASDHHLHYVSHMEIRGEHMYICGSVVERGDSMMVGYVMKGNILDNTWDTLAYSAPYYMGLSFNDHRFSSLTIDLDGEHVYVHSGSRTNAGEVHELPGALGTKGLRDQPIRGKLFKLPTNLEQPIYLPNDSSLLAATGYLYASGFRHLFAMGIGLDYQLYGASNSDRRDVPEAFYRIDKDGHYGFPWWIGGIKNPLQFSSYNPGNDLLLPAGANNEGYYNTDSSFPPLPTTISFIQPYKNIGPDADQYRDAHSGVIMDASDNNTSITSFSGHRSPVGLTFDLKKQLPNAFEGAGYMVSYTNHVNLLNDDGHDLVQLNLLGADSLSAKKLMKGFIRPMDVLIRDTVLYVLESGNYDGSERKIYAVNFKDTSTVGFSDFDVTNNDQIRLIPNPTFGKVKIEVTGSSQVKEVIIYDQTGRLVKHRIGLETEVDMSNLPPLIYLFEVQLNNGKSIVKKLKKE